MTYEEAIKHFRSLQKRYTTEHNGKMCEKVALALAAMEKQVPKKPYWEYGGYHCKSCGLDISEDDAYCLLCGQRIDWSDCDD